MEMPVIKKFESSTNTPNSLDSKTISKPFPCRRPVRIVLSVILGAFVFFTFVWGFLPPLLDPTFEQHIKDKKVIVGMTRDQAIEAWGSPYQMMVTYIYR